MNDTYNPEDITVTIGGVEVLGYHTSEVVKVDRNPAVKTTHFTCEYEHCYSGYVDDFMKWNAAIVAEGEEK